MNDDHESLIHDTLTGIIRFTQRILKNMNSAGSGRDMEKRIALCIGNNDYQYLPQLLCAGNDANSMGEALYRLGYETTVKTNLNRTEMGSIIFEFAEKIKDYDSCLFFYAGHGFEVASENLLVPIDSNIPVMASDREIIFNAFRLQDLLDMFEDCQDKVKVLVIDACRNVANTRGVNRGFAAMSAPQGTVIAFSTSPGKSALEDASLQHGMYTKCLLKYMQEERMPIESVFKKVREELHRMTNGRQLPWEHTSLIGTYYLNRTYSEESVSEYIDSVEISYKEKEREMLLQPGHMRIMTEWKYPHVQLRNDHGHRKAASIDYINAVIAELYEKTGEEWEEWYTDIEKISEAACIYNGERDPYSDGLTFEVLLNQAGILCVRFDRYIYTGGTHGTPVWIIKVFDLNFSRELKLKDLIPRKDEDILQEIRVRFAEEKRIHQVKRPTIYPDFELDDYRTPEDYKWYIDEDGIHIYFDVYEAAPYSEGFVSFLLTDQVYLEREGEYKKIILERRRLIQNAIDELIGLYEDRYIMKVDQRIGGMNYRIIACGSAPEQYNTFWLIKAIKYNQYGMSFMKKCVDELMDMKQNYESITDRQIIAELYIIWDEEEDSDIRLICEHDFNDILSQYENTLHVQYRRMDETFADLNV